MSFDLSGIDAARERALPALRQQQPAASPAHAAATPVVPDRFDAIPASPPARLRHEMLAAQRAVDDMRARGRELHFEMTDGRLRIEMRDLDGNVLREIPPTEALAIASGRLTD